MASIYDWSTTANSNASISGSSINWAENQAPSTINNSARAEMADVAGWRNLLGATKITSGTNTMTLTSGLSLTAYSQGLLFAFENGATNTGACTINIDSIGAKDIKKYHNVALSSGDLVAGGLYIIGYEATAGNFQLLSPVATGSSAPSTITIADESTDTTCFPLFTTAATGDLAPKTGTNITFNSNTGELAATKMTPTSLGATTLSGAITGADQIVSAINLKDYGEVTNAIGATGGGTQDINLTLGNSVTATVDTSANTFTFSNPTASDELCGFTLELTNGGSQTVNWPGTVDWAGGSAPTLTTSGVDYLVFWTVNGGSRWYGALVGLAFA